MLTEAQIRLRRSLVTATDARILAGMDPYGLTSHDVFLSKVLAEPPPFGVTVAMMSGNDVEPIVLKHLARKRNLVLTPSTTLVHPTIRHHGATPDALGPPVDGVPEYGAEVKTVGFRVAGEWDPTDPEGFPEWVLPQVAFCMYITGAQRWYVGAILGTTVGTWVVERADVADLIDALIDVADRFWIDHVLPKRPPQLDASDGAMRMIRQLVGRASNGVMLRASSEADAAARMYFEAQRDLKAAEARKQHATSLLIAATGGADGLVGDGFRFRFVQQAAYDVAGYHVDAARKPDMRASKK